jgi:hypothetical protein
MLNKAVTNKWESAEDIARKAMLPFHSATKMLCSMAAEGRIECKEEHWIDERCRERKRTLYRRKPEVESLHFLDSIFGIPHPVPPLMGANVRRHELR